MPVSGMAPSSLIELLLYRARYQPDQRAYTFLVDGETGEVHLTHKELDRQARAIASHLQDLGATGERALLLYPPGLAYIAAFFGCLYAGVVAVPAYPPDPMRIERTLPRLRAIVHDARPAIVLTTSMIQQLAGALAAQAPDFQAMRWLATDALAAGDEERWQPPDASGDTLAVLQYTSGSTAAPKGVMLTHANLLHNSALIAHGFAHTPASCGVIWLPPYHDMGLIGGIIQPLYAGFPVTLMSPVDFLQRPLRWLQAISRFHATTSGGPNFAYDMCVRKITPEQRATLDLSSWAVAFNGAEPIRADTLERFAAAFAPCGFRAEALYPCYGLAEATLIVSGRHVAALPAAHGFHGGDLEQNQAVVAEAGRTTRTLVSCGSPLLDQQVAIVQPESLARCPAGRVGEIWVRGPSIARGYWNQPAETAQTFRATLADGAEGPFLRTGDLGFVYDGELFVTGRLKDMLIIRGRNHYPQDIELTVERSHPALRPGCGAAFTVEADGEERLVVVQEVERQPVDVDAVARAIREAVAEQHELQVFRVVLLKARSIPKTSSGKIQRHACRERFLDASLDVVGQSVLERAGDQQSNERLSLEALLASAPNADGQLLERYIQQLLARITGVSASEVGVEQPVSGLGIDSLMAVEMTYCIKDDLGLDVSVAPLLQGLSVAEIAAYLHALRQEDANASLAPPPIRPSGTTTQAPLAFVQERLWFLNQFAPGSCAYTIPFVVRMSGALHVPALARSLHAIARRHNVLRATVSIADGQPVQIVSAAIPRLTVVDLGGLAVQARAAESQRLIRELVEQPFDLLRGPLLRFVLLRLAGEEHVLLLTVQHIVSDGWSLNVFVRELGTLYAAFSAGVPASLPALPVQYSDYVVWQRAWLHGAVLEFHLAYWRRQLAELSPLHLPTDRPHPPIPSFRGASRSFALSPQLTSALHELSRRAGATMFMTLLAAFQTLLYRYSQQHDIVVGTPIANRTRREIEGLIGCFVNTLVLRAGVDGRSGFRELLERVRGVCLDAYAHQELPFERLVDALQPARDLSRNPIFQVMFVLQNSPTAALKLPGLALDYPEIERTASKFDLTLELVESAGALRGSIEYATDLFDATTIVRLAGHFEMLLVSIAAEPERALATLPLLTASEQQQLVAWNATQAAYPQDVCLHHLVEAQVERTPDAVALVFDGRGGDRETRRQGDKETGRPGDRETGQDTQSSVLSPQSSVLSLEHLSYRELNRRANQLARALVAQGVGLETRVGICLERSLELVVGLLGALKAGAAYVPLDPGYPAQRLAFMLSDAGVPVLLTQKSIYDLRFTIYDLEGNGNQRRDYSQPPTPNPQPLVVCLDSDWEKIARYDGDNFGGAATTASLAYVIYTSGSTGQPKGAMNTHRGIVNRLLWMQHAYRLDEHDHVLQKTPASFDVSVWEFFWPLISGAQLVLAQPGGQRDSHYLAALIAEQRITTLHFVPSLLQVFLAEPNLARCTSLRRVICSGEALPAELQRQFFARLGAELHNLYGPTEAAVDVTFWACQRGDEARSVPIGRPIANTQVYLLDAALQPLPAGVPGELFIGGVNLARGYLNRPDLTAERFIPNPFAIGDWGLGIGDTETRRHEGTEIRDEINTQSSVLSPQSSPRLYRTGDLARYRADGAIEFLGRIDQQVKLRGNRVELGEIEAALAEHPAVREAAVVLREDVPGDMRLVGYIVPNAEYRMQNAEAQKPDTSALRAFLKERLPDYMLPAAFVLLDALPLTPNGKLDRRALPAPEILSTERRAGTYVAPRSEAERVIAMVWQDVLHLDQPGVYDNFFDLGGSSILMVKIQQRLREILQRDLSLVDLFAHPTIDALAGYVSQVEQRPAELPPDERLAETMAQGKNRLKQRLSKNIEQRKK